MNTDLPKKMKRFEHDAGEEEDFGYDKDPEMVGIVAEQFHEEPDQKTRKPDNSHEKRYRVESDAVVMRDFGDEEHPEMVDEGGYSGSTRDISHKPSLLY